MLKGAIIGAIAGAVAVLLLVIFQPARKCPDCGAPVPKFRKPATAKQAMWGGCACAQCGCQMDRKGREIGS